MSIQVARNSVSSSLAAIIYHEDEWATIINGKLVDDMITAPKGIIRYKMEMIQEVDLEN